MTVVLKTHDRRRTIRPFEAFAAEIKDIPTPTITLVAHQGNVFEIAPERAEVLIIFGRSGINVWNITWQNFRTRNSSRLPMDLRLARSPWYTHTQQCWHTKRPIGRLKCMFFIGNEAKERALDDAACSAETQAAFQAVFTANPSVESIMFSGIPPNSGSGEERVELHKKDIVRWAESAELSTNLTVHLVSISKDYQKHFNLELE
jgi:hypothetical protein